MFQSADRVWINANLATLDPDHSAPYGALSNYALAVREGRILALMPMRALDQRRLQAQLPPDQITDAKGAWLTPGLIDSHTHLLYAGTRAQELEQRLLGTPYAEIARQGGGILATVRATRGASVEQLLEQSVPRLEALIAEGVTRVEIKSGYGLDLETELRLLRAARTLAQRYPVQVSTTLLAAHAVPPEYAGRADAYIEHVCETIIPAAAAEGLADAVDLFCEQIAFTPAQCERVMDTACRYGLGLKAHVEQLSNLHGAALAARYGAWSVDHLEYLEPSDIPPLVAAGTVATLLPGAFYCLGETRRPPVVALREAGVPLAVASDLNPGSSPLASLRLAMHLACTLFGLTPEEALAGVTRHAAAALGLAGECGQLKPGLAADMLLWDIAHPAQLACEFGVNPIRQRIIAGEIVHG